MLLGMILAWKVKSMGAESQYVPNKISSCCMQCCIYIAHDGPRTRAERH